MFTTSRFGFYEYRSDIGADSDIWT